MNTLIKMDLYVLGIVVVALIAIGALAFTTMNYMFHGDRFDHATWLKLVSEVDNLHKAVTLHNKDATAHAAPPSVTHVPEPFTEETGYTMGGHDFWF